MKWLAIFNPRAGYHLPEDGHDLSALLRRQFGADIAWSRSRKHAWHLARDNWSYDGFIAVGGDGTISEVVNGSNLDQHSLGIIPAGTGNDLARHLGIKSVATALHVLRQGRFEQLDVVSVRWLSQRTWRQRFLVSTSGIGYLAGATAVAELPFKRWGPWTYAAAAIIQSFRQSEF